MKIAIIGAGIAGLTVANHLKDFADIVIFDKSRGAGGRICTRYAKPYVFDHGAQFFIARTNKFKNFLEPMIEAGVIQSWNAKFVEIKKDKIISRRQWDNDNPHYVGSPTMSSIGKYLSQDLNVQLNSEISINRSKDQWQIVDKEGNDQGVFDWVISTAPVSQSAILLPVDFKFHETLLSRKMMGCFSLMIGFDDSLNLAWEAALVSEADISWISVNSSKPGRNGSFTLLVHSTNSWAEENINQEKDAVIEHLMNETSKIIGKKVYDANHIDLHRWKYANIKKQNVESPFIDEGNQLAACGDWCIKGRIESAFLSGFDLANEMRSLIN
jgi:predicted NAD/FAD-dependent oxidoreductase